MPSYLEFASDSSCSHLCGHDIHTASLLVTLIMLKEDEDRLPEQIKFLFQPAEETLNGGRLMVEHIGKAFRAETNYEVAADVPALKNSLEMAILVKESAEEVLGPDYAVEYTDSMLASDDYAHIAYNLPESCYFFVSCPLPDKDGNVFAVHNPKAEFDEEALIIGPAAMAQAAVKWLEKNKR